MSDKDNGGPAFPTHEFRQGQMMAVGGMSLRDYFAAHAPIYVSDANNAFYRQNGRNAHQSEMLKMLATLRAGYADAMLEARQS